MEWHREDEDDETVWVREDETATVRVRQTATGTWAVTLDRLEQAPDGRAYRHEIFGDRSAADAQAAEWRTDP